jgi:hypothetical protein
VAVSGWLLAGCGESRQDALNKLAAATRDTRATSDVIDERVAAGVYGYLPCFEMQLKAAALIRQRRELASGLRYRDEPPAEVSAQKELDHAADLFAALAKCIAHKAGERAVEELQTALGRKTTRLGDALDDYVDATPGPLKETLKSEVEQDEAKLK